MHIDSFMKHFRKISQILYILFAVVLPLISMSFFGNDYIHGNDRIFGLYYFLLVLFFIPVFSIYAVILVREYFPKTIKGIFFLFIPIGISFTGLWPYINSYSTVSLQTVLFATTAPYIIGLASIMGGGVVYLTFKMINSKGLVTFNDWLLRMLVLTLIVAPWTYFIVIITLSGLAASQNMITPAWLNSSIWFGLQICFVMASLYPKLVEQYSQGNL